MTLPAFREDGWLPEGHYEVSWEEVVDRFGGSPGSQRERVLYRLLSWRDEAREKGISGLLLLNGSFISARETISDFDALLVYDDHVEELRKNDVEAEGLSIIIIAKIVALTCGSSPPTLSERRLSGPTWICSTETKRR